MRRTKMYRPASLDELETRVVLSRVALGPTAAALAGVVPGARTPGRRVAPVVGRVNAAFDSFVQDYTQARGVYLSLLDGGASKEANTAFTMYTRYRVELLGQQLTSLFVPSAAGGGSHQSKGANTNLFRLVQTRVSGLELETPTSSSPPTPTGKVFRLGTLGRSLLDSTPAVGTPPAVASLDSLAQDQAIEASRIAVINGFTYNKLMNSGHGSK